MSTERTVPAVMPSIEEFRAEARAWLASRRPPARADNSGGHGDDSVAVFHDVSSAEEQERLDAAVSWQRARRAAGFAGISIPVDYGGLGLPANYEQAYLDEESRVDVPPMPEVLGVTVRLAAPTISVWGTHEQKLAFVEALLDCDLICCQLFSEPDAGSDLANIGCQAELDGGGWRLTGQKVWTSGAQFADIGVALCRTDADASKHRGLTAFLVPMEHPGVEVRPIRQMTGGSAFNEVFLQDVDVPDDHRLGDPGTGWKVALTMLGFERVAAASAMQGIGGSFERVLGLARWRGMSTEPRTRQALARVFTADRVQQLTMDRLASTDAARGLEGSIGKLLWTQRLTDIGSIAAALLGPRLQADTGEWGTYCWTEHLLGSPGYRIAGGSDEIQRNILGERLLGLPPEPKG